MPIENEPVAAEKIRKKKFIALLGQCLDCGQPVKEGQEFFRSETEFDMRSASLIRRSQSTSESLNRRLGSK